MSEKDTEEGVSPALLQSDEDKQELLGASGANVSDDGQQGEEVPINDITNNDGLDPMTLPPHGTEIYVGGLHRDVTEQHLLAFAEQMGDVFSVNLPTEEREDKKGTNRGYGFVTYKDVESAIMALDGLHGSSLENFEGHPVRIKAAEVKNKLYIHGIPQDMNSEALKSYIESKFPEVVGLLSVTMPKKVPQRSGFGGGQEENRGFAFLDFYNHRCAALAKSILSKPGNTIEDKELQLDYAEPSFGDCSGLNVPYSIYIGNLPADDESNMEEKLREAFSKYGEIRRIDLPRAKFDRHSSGAKAHAFLHFKQRISAYRAKSDDHSPKIDGQETVVRLRRTDGNDSKKDNRQSSDRRNRFEAPRHMEGMVPMVPIQLPNGQIGYMMQPAAMMGGGWGSGSSRGRGYRHHDTNRNFGRGNQRFRGGRHHRGGFRNSRQHQRDRYGPY
jgi:heterogeneous nuclear ribonucleoprotein R